MNVFPRGEVIPPVIDEAIMKRKDICFIDFETTGSDLYNDHPIQFGAAILSIQEMKISKEFDSLIRVPEEASISETAFQVHGYRLEDLKDAPTPHEVMKGFFESMGLEYSFGGWNVCFDVGFFRRICYEVGYDRQYNEISHRHVEVQSIARALVDAGILPRDVDSLDSLCKVLGIRRRKKHRALEDARVTAKIYVHLTNKLREESFLADSIQDG
jgi:DNA polymerase III epsilon subunit-like protein